MVTLNYTEVPLIEQPYSSYSEYVNPHAVYGWQGRMELSPPSDEWKEVTTKPQLAANASTSYNWFIEADADTANGGLFNDWQVNWFGVSPEEEEELRNQLSEGTLTVRGGSILASDGNTVGQITRPSSGVYNNTQTSQVSDTVVNNTIVPYIRSRKIYFRATGLKPSSRVYAFFDGVDMTNYVRTEDAMINYTTNPDDKNYAGLTAHPSGATPLTTTPYGEVIGSFIIPHNDAMKFRTGERTFRIIDNSLNNTDSAFTYAEGIYRATGIFVPAPTPAVQPPVVIPTPKPGPAPSVPPFVGIAIQGLTPKYNGIPFNFIAVTSATGYGSLASLVMEERSNASDPNFGYWVPLVYQSGTTSGISGNAVFRISPALPGTYQVRARAVWSGVTYYSNTISFTVASAPLDISTLPEAERYTQ